MKFRAWLHITYWRGACILEAPEKGKGSLQLTVRGRRQGQPVQPPVIAPLRMAGMGRSGETRAAQIGSGEVRLAEIGVTHIQG